MIKADAEPMPIAYTFTALLVIFIAVELFVIYRYAQRNKTPDPTPYQRGYRWAEKQIDNGADVDMVRSCMGIDKSDGFRKGVEAAINCNHLAGELINEYECKSINHG